MSGWEGAELVPCRPCVEVSKLLGIYCSGHWPCWGGMPGVGSVSERSRSWVKLQLKGMTERPGWPCGAIQAPETPSPSAWGAKLLALSQSPHRPDLTVMSPPSGACRRMWGGREAGPGAGRCSHCRGAEGRLCRRRRAGLGPGTSLRRTLLFFRCLRRRTLQVLSVFLP